MPHALIVIANLMTLFAFWAAYVFVVRAGFIHHRQRTGAPASDEALKRALWILAPLTAAAIAVYRSFGSHIDPPLIPFAGAVISTLQDILT